MGNQFIAGFQELEIPLRDIVSMHFSGNCYPPIPQFMVDCAVEAIEAANEGDGYREITLPDGVTHRHGKTAVTAWEIIENCRLEGLLDDEADDY